MLSGGTSICVISVRARAGIRSKHAQFRGGTFRKYLKCLRLTAQLTSYNNIIIAGSHDTWLAGDGCFFSPLHPCLSKVFKTSWHVWSCFHVCPITLPFLKWLPTLLMTNQLKIPLGPTLRKDMPFFCWRTCERDWLCFFPWHPHKWKLLAPILYNRDTWN